MAQKYNIYINQKSLIIGNYPLIDVDNYQLVDDEGFDFMNFYLAAKKSAQHQFYLFSTHPKNTFKAIKAQLKVIEAAGGLVVNEERKYLFIKRNGKWDLPKGKLEPKEKKKDAAVREVEEECGIKIKKLGKKLIKTYHVYEIKAKPVLKVSHWYEMEAKGDQKLIPQKEEGITEVKWFGKRDWKIIRTNTYLNILDVLNLSEQSGAQAKVK